MLGQTLAHYKILEKIGSGGMGDVYLAEDTKLDRNIALKVLPAELAESNERRARFEREAKAIAALNHPNIITVYSVEQADGVHFITMELVKGKTLAELLPKKGFPLDKFLDVAIPLADAVAAAHEEGIIHRDLKPGNVMVTDDGRVKVLDFGIARTEAPLKANVDSESPTELKTREGTLAGTLHYMSPEQADGKTLDRRSDIFSLGVIFYALLTGQRPLQGDSPATTLSSVLKDDPKPVTEHRPGLPHDLARIVRRCLAKDAEKRFQTSKDVRNELEDLKVAMSSGQLEAPSARPTRPNRLSIALVLILAALAVYTFRGRPSESDRAPLRLTNAIQVTGALGVEDYPVWSPDGKTLAYASTTTGDLTGGNWDILVTPLGAPEPLNRTSDHQGEDRYPA